MREKTVIKIGGSAELLVNVNEEIKRKCGAIEHHHNIKPVSGIVNEKLLDC
nr:hypothetical protein [uncultured Acetobacterium sp.]